MGLLDFMNSPTGQGLLSAVAAGAAGARKGTPWNNFGRGALGGLAGYADAQDQLQQKDENAFQRQFRQMQLDQARQQMADQQAQRDWRAGLPAMMQQQSAAPNENTKLMAEAMGSTAAPQVVDNRDALQSYMMQPGSPFADKLVERQLFPAAADYKVVGDNLVRIGSTGVEPVFTAGRGMKFSQDVTDYLNARGIDPATADTQTLSSAYDAVQAIKDKRARLSAQTVTLGTPQIFTTPEGQTAFVQPANRPGAAPQVTYLDPKLKPSTSDKPPTEAENTAAGFLSRMRAAENLVQEHSGGGESTELTSAAASVPGIGKYVQRKVMTPQQQLYKQAADDWIRAKLRKESGAVIGADEMAAEYENYFPQPGETDQNVIAQKAASRREAEKQFEISAGRALEKIENKPAGKGAQIKAQPLPAKPNPLTLKKGVVYQTPKGPLRWNGKAFEDAQ